jgi:hypothetical protein
MDKKILKKFNLGFEIDFNIELLLQAAVEELWLVAELFSVVAAEVSN